MGSESEIRQRLTGDNSNLRSVFNQSERLAEVTGKSILKKLDIRAGVVAIAAAVGFNINSIAEGIARLVTSSTKEAEEALESVLKLGEETARIYDEIYRKRRSEQQNIESDVAKQNRLLNEQGEILGGISKRQEEIDAKNKLIAEERRKRQLTGSLVGGPQLIDAAGATEAQQKRLAEIANELAKLQQSIDEAKRTRDEKAARTTEENLKKEKEARKEIADEDLEWYKKRHSLEEQLREQSLRKMTDEEKVVFFQQEIYKWKQQQAKLDKDSNEFKALQVKINENLLDIETARTKTAKALTAEMRAQQAAVEAQNEAQAKANMLLNDTIILMGEAYGTSRDPRDIARASDLELTDLIEKNRALIATIESNKGRGATAAADVATGFLPQGIVQARLQTDIQRALYQLDLRNNTRRDIQEGGLANARARFGGDPLQFDDFVQRFASNTSELTKIASGVDKLVQRLDRGIPTVLFGTDNDS